MSGPLDLFPLWALLLATVGVVLLSIEVGYRLGGYRSHRSEAEKEGPVGAMVGSTLGLLAFMLAFTFGLAASRFEDRRQVVLEEANAIGTTYLRAAMLPKPLDTQTRDLLREYVDVRLEAVQQGNIDQAVAKSEELHKSLWSQAVAAAEKERSPFTSLFTQSLNEVIDLHSKRIMVAFQSRIPGVIWVALYSLLILAMTAIGYNAGVTNAKRSFAVLALALAFSAVLYLIADLDRPGRGLLNVSQQSMIDLRRSM